MAENIVYVGTKPPMNYVLAVIRAFNQMGAENVVLKARGRAISRAVDVAEIASRRFLTDIQTSNIEIGSEEMPLPYGGTRGVSTISIIMTKKGEAEAPKTVTTPTLDVSEIKGVGGARAEKLNKAGFTTVESLAEADPAKLSELTGISEKFSAKIIESAKKLLKQK
jgi:DNA-binding protein